MHDGSPTHVALKPSHVIISDAYIITIGFVYLTETKHKQSMVHVVNSRIIYTLLYLINFICRSIKVRSTIM